MCYFSAIITLAAIPVEGKSSVCLICMKYRVIILLSLSAWVKYFYRILQTHLARTHACAHTRRRRRRTGYRYSLAPNSDGLLRWRRCRSLAIQINTRAGDPISPRFWMFFTHNKLLGRTETRTRDGCTVRRYEQLETSPETIEQELRPAVCEYRQTDLRRIIV